jgi:hypothetical protein
VVIPFRSAILTAFMKRLKDDETIQLRIRRDVHGLLTAVTASSIVHKAQRKRDAAGRIVATLDDYAHAHDAFDQGLAHLYKVQTPETALAVVTAVEAMGATATNAVKVTGRALKAKLGISSKGAATDRLNDAIERGFIVLEEKEGGYGATTARKYTIGQSSADIEAEMKAKPPGVFPTPDEVKQATEEETALCAVCGRPGASFCAWGDRTASLHLECQVAFIAHEEARRR